VFFPKKHISVILEFKIKIYMCMRFLKLKINDKIITDPIEINKILSKQKFYWLIDSEIEMADIEIIHDTIIWNSGNFYAGNWHYGIWKGGNFYGIWENGIFEVGKFEGKFLSGIKNI